MLNINRGALGAATALSVLALCACDATSSAATADAKKKVPVTTVIPATTTTVTTTTPTPTTTTISVDNPTIGQAPGVGAADIATADHNVLDDLQPSWGNGAIPASNAP